jgi:hypothetical protein
LAKSLALVAALLLGCSDSSSASDVPSGDGGWDGDATADVQPLGTPDGPKGDALFDAAAGDGSPSGDAGTGVQTDAGYDGPVEAGGDGSATIDSGGATCGATVCRGGQVCVSGSCQFQGCSGAHVPGDYASVQSAVTALKNVGGTICITGSYAEDVSITMSGKDLTLMGSSASTASVRSVKVTGGDSGAATLTIEGLAVTSGGVAAAFTGALDIVDCDIEAPAGTASLSVMSLGYIPGLSSSAPQLDVSIRYSKVASPGTNETCIDADSIHSLLVDGVDVSCTLVGIYIGSLPAATVENSFVHASIVGVSLYLGPANVVNNTFVGNQRGLITGNGGGGAVSLGYYDNLFVSNGTAVDLEAQGTAVVTNFGTNAFWQNTAKFNGTAIEGAGDVNADPLLDQAAPPGLMSASPCIGAADPAHAAATDFYGRSRGTKPDIGAVQGP